MNERKLTIIESPYGGESFDRNILYLRQCLRDSWDKGELPFASHGFFPFFLREALPLERKLGIEAGYQFWDLRTVTMDTHTSIHGSPWVLGDYPLVVFYVDFGLSPGMQRALERCQGISRPHLFRRIIETKQESL